MFALCATVALADCTFSFCQYCCCWCLCWTGEISDLITDRWKNCVVLLLNVCHYNTGKLNDSKDEFVSLLPKLKTRVADTPGNVAEMLSKELARVCTCFNMIKLSFIYWWCVRYDAWAVFLFLLMLFFSLSCLIKLLVCAFYTSYTHVPIVLFLYSIVISFLLLSSSS